MKPTPEQLDEQDCLTPQPPEAVGVTVPAWLAELVAKRKAAKTAPPEQTDN